MAPIDFGANQLGQQSMEAVASMDGMIISAVSALLVGITLIVAAAICGCCGKKEQQVPEGVGGGGGDLYYSTDPARSDFCPECAAAAAAGEQPTVLAPDTQLGISKGFGPSMHRFPHKTAIGGGGGSGSPKGSVGGSQRSAGAKAPTASTKSQEKPMSKNAGSPKQDFKMAGSIAGGHTKAYERGPLKVAGARPPSESQMNKAAENPAYQTLFGAQSGVFDQGAPQPKGALTTQQLGTKSASNPAYQTLFGAQSDVFKGGAPAQSKVGKSARPPEQSGGYR